MRSRGLSEISHQSIGSNDEDILLGNRFSYPLRQPYGAPEFIGQKQGFHHRPIRQPNKPPPNMVGARVEGFMSFPQRLPSRRPISPPTDLAQQHAGFQRFLKEHASPPHHRVTAGGRIVPANGPPPIFNVNSLTGAIKSPLRPDTTAATNTVKADEVKKRAASVSGPLFASAASRHGILVSGASEQSGIVQTATPQDPSTGKKEDQTTSHQAQTGTTLQYPPNTAPIMLLQDGTTFVMQNGLPHRVYSNGFATFAEPVPLLFAQQGAAAPLTSANLLQPAVPSQPKFASPYGPLPDSLLLNSNPSLHTHLAHESSDQTVRQQHEYLRYELQSLDRHIALNGKRFGRHDHLAYVTLRKQLVQQLDLCRRRLSRTPSSETTGQHYQYISLGAQPNVSQSTDRTGVKDNHATVRVEPLPPSTNFSSTKSMPLKLNKATQAPSLPDVNNTGVAQQLKTPSVKSSAGIRKVLSPEAPPFIPGSLRADAARKVESCIPSGEIKEAFLNSRPDSTTSAITAGNFTLPSRSVSNKENMTLVQSSGTQVEQQHPTGFSHTKNGTSGSAMEAIVPEVHQQDIAYVDKMALNPIYGPKKFCSTVHEVQEVIRRVREQARLYGCKGGSSKDPEFDAEQDIRWAISDTTPIPLPKKIPDHIAHPRPWYWEDSAFNIHADRSNLHKSSTCDKQQDTNNMTAHNPTLSQSNANVNTRETTPKSSSHLTQESPSVEDRSLGAIATTGEPAAEVPFMSSRQAAILRETHRILGIMPSNNLSSDTGFGVNDQRGIGSSAPSNILRSETVKDPFAGNNHMMTAGVDSLGASPAAKPIVKLPHIGPSGLPSASKALKSGFGNDTPSENAAHKMFGNNDQSSTGTPRYGTNCCKSLMPRTNILQTSATNRGTSSFLEKLLKSPLYSSASLSQHETMSSASNHVAGYTHGMSHITNKENIRSENGTYGEGFPSTARHANNSQKQRFYPGHGFGKSRSSVAPTNTYAHAQMQVQSGKAGGPFQSLDWEIRHHPPSPSDSVRGAQTSATSSPYRQHNMPQYDGAGESSPRQTKVRPDKPEEDQKRTTPRELDPKVFKTDNNEIPAGHGYAVEAFLKRLKQAEDEDMAEHPPPKGPKKS